MDRVRILERAGNQVCEAVYDSETQYQDVELGLLAMPCKARVIAEDKSRIITLTVTQGKSHSCTWCTLQERTVCLVAC